MAYAQGSKVGFEELRRSLAPLGLTPWLTGNKEECVLTIRKSQPPAKRVSRIPLVLLLLSLVSVIAFSLLERTIYGKLAPDMGGLLVIFAYSLSITAVLAGHELGHRYSARRSRETPPTSYLIPGVPDVTSFLPAVGPLSTQKGPAVNRDRLFDVMVWGPLAALIVSLVLYAVGGLTSVSSSVPLNGNLIINPYISANQINPSVLQFLVDSVFAPQVPSGYVQLSPVADGASAGFLLTFIGLLPMSSFDGGLLSVLAWGKRASRLGTYLGALALIALDSLNYWAVAIMVLLLAGRQADLQLLDEVSGISRRRRWAYGGAIVLAFLCVPIPKNILTVPLG